MMQILIIFLAGAGIGFLVAKSRIGFGACGASLPVSCYTSVLQNTRITKGGK